MGAESSRACCHGKRKGRPGMQNALKGLVAAAFVAVVAVVSLKAAAPSGAIFTTVVDGSEVNYNIYQAKEDRLSGRRPRSGRPANGRGPRRRRVCVSGHGPQRQNVALD